MATASENELNAYPEWMQDAVTKIRNGGFYGKPFPEVNKGGYRLAREHNIEITDYHEILAVVSLASSDNQAMADIK